MSGSPQSGQRTLRHPDTGGVDHLAVDRDGTETGGIGGGIGIYDLPGPGDLRGGGGEDVVGDQDLGGVNAPLAVVAEGAGDAAGLAKPVFVAEIGIRAVDNPDSGGTAGDEDAAHWVVPAVAGVGGIPLVGDAELGDGGADRRGVVAGAEGDRFDARTRGGDAFAVDQTFGGFDLDFEADLVVDAGGELNLIQECRDHVNVLGTVHLRDDDEREPVAGRFDDVDQIAIAIGSVEGVDPVGARFAVPVLLT